MLFTITIFIKTKKKEDGLRRPQNLSAKTQTYVITALRTVTMRLFSSLFRLHVRRHPYKSLLFLHIACSAVDFSMNEKYRMQE